MDDQRGNYLGYKVIYKYHSNIYISIYYIVELKNYHSKAYNDSKLHDIFVITVADIFYTYSWYIFQIVIR